MAPNGFTWIEKPRLAALAIPQTREDFAWLRAEGIDLLISLTEDRPRRDWVDDASLLLYHVPIQDMEAPSQDQLDRCVSAVQRAHQSSLCVAIHCTAGLGRTGAVLAAFFVAEGATALNAINKIRRLRPGSIETNEQEEAIHTYARRLKQLTEQ